ncbi:MAG: leucine-rich repeat domain-containing protein [Tannerellaceae bacterium]|jgi:Leucine-rich repeat (LRR) protein|nr:leucine-rich repeat domain-containing protein [Tannerellaceae bacterium]
MNNSEIIKQIEKLLNISFEYPTEDVPLPSNAYIVAENEIKALYLSFDSKENLPALANLLEKLDGLVILQIKCRNLSDLSPLQNLTQIAVLDLSDNQISDLRPLSRLTQLEYLFLSGNPISDVSPLSALTQLELVELDNNPT